MSFKLRTVTTLVLILAVSLSTFSQAMAETVPGASCSPQGKTTISNFYEYTCIKAPRSLSNPLGKKLVWRKGAPVPKSNSYKLMYNVGKNLARVSTPDDTAKSQCASAKNTGFINQNGRMNHLGSQYRFIQSHLRTTSGFQGCIDGFNSP
jgi:hypothetical protein